MVHGSKRFLSLTLGLMLISCILGQSGFFTMLKNTANNFDSMKSSSAVTAIEEAATKKSSKTETVVQARPRIARRQSQSQTNAKVTKSCKKVAAKEEVKSYGDRKYTTSTPEFEICTVVTRTDTQQSTKYETCVVKPDIKITTTIEFRDKASNEMKKKSFVMIRPGYRHCRSKVVEKMQTSRKQVRPRVRRRRRRRRVRRRRRKVRRKRRVRRKVRRRRRRKKQPVVPNINVKKFDLSSIIIGQVKSIVKQEVAEIPKIEDRYNKLCLETLKTKATRHVSTPVSQIRKNLACKRLILGIGEVTKKLNLGTKMIGFYLDAVNNEVFDVSRCELEINSKAQTINDRIKKVMKRRMGPCYSSDTSCMLKNKNIRYMGRKAHKWFSLHKKAADQIKNSKMVMMLPQSLFDPGRLLQTAKAKAEVKPKAESMLEIKKKRIRINLIRTMMKMNSLIRGYESQTEEQRRKIYAGMKKINLSRKRGYCEEKYGPGNCVQVSKVAYCYNCQFGTEIYWKEDGNCGCDMPVGVTKEDIARNVLLTLQFNPETIGMVSRKRTEELIHMTGLEGRKERDHFSRIMTERVLSVSDSFYFEIEDSEV